jgi:hypothetical protein
MRVLDWYAPPDKTSDERAKVYQAMRRTPR